MSFIKKLLGLEKPVEPKEDTVGYVTTLHGNAELAVAESLLRDADSPYRLIDRDKGGVTRIVAGYSMYGTALFVRPEDVEAARALLAPVEQEGEQEDGAEQ